MAHTTKRNILGRGTGYLNAAGPQSRFIIFLIFVLIGYTVLLRVFQKLADILQLPIFLPVSLISLLLFIGVIGTVYSHAFVGPIIRIRRAIDQLARGDVSVALRLRESDDPMLKELVSSITRLSEHNRNAHSLIQASSEDLFAEIHELLEAFEQGAEKTEIRKKMDMVEQKRELLEKAIQSIGK